MKTRALALTIILAAAAAPCFAGSVRLTGSLSADFLKGTGSPASIGSFTGPDQPRFAGVGWEVIFGKVGIGGDYMASFFREADGLWWADWYAQPLFVSLHPIRRGFALDPFVQAGVGSAGRVFLHDWTSSPYSNLFLSIFPFVAAGLNLNLEGFLVGAKVSYAPFMTPPPATAFITPPFGEIQVTLSAGISLDW